MKIYRQIWVKEVSQIDYKNLGNHWSTNENLVFNPFTESNELRGENEDDYIQIWIEAEIQENQIHEDNEILGGECAGESEIITAFNTDIEIIVATEDDVVFEGVANTGERYQEISC